MLKTLNIKLIEPWKGIVRVSGSKKEHSDRVEPVSKNKIDDNEIRDNEVGKKD